MINQLEKIVGYRNAQQLFSKYGYDVKSYSKIAPKYSIRGAVYFWDRVIAALPFDISTVIPYSISYDNGKTFTRKITDKFKSRMATSIDVDWHFGDKYKNITKSIPYKNANGEETGYSIVEKMNGKYNYLDINTRKEVLPIDFDNITFMNPNTGKFQIDYKGKTLDATLNGFIDQFGEETDYSELDDYIEQLNFFKDI